MDLYMSTEFGTYGVVRPLWGITTLPSARPVDLYDRPGPAVASERLASWSVGAIMSSLRQVGYPGSQVERAV